MTRRNRTFLFLKKRNRVFGQFSLRSRHRSIHSFIAAKQNMAFFPEEGNEQTASNNNNNNNNFDPHTAAAKVVCSAAIDRGTSHTTTIVRSVTKQLLSRSRPGRKSLLSQWKYSQFLW
jgi:hypothetical protein